MHFGRVKNVSGIDFALPADAPRTRAFLALDWGGAGRMHVGGAIWKFKPSDRLAGYASRYGTVEVNSTFYHLLDAPRIDAWRRQVPASFRFCPKLYRGITERPAAPELAELVTQCATGMAAFGETFGLAFAQFPETLGPAQLPLVKRVLDFWPRELPLAVELRHPGWFRNHALIDEAVNLLYRHGTATVITDTPGRRDAVHTSFAQPRVMIRYLGLELDPLDERRLTDWAGRMREWAAQGMDDLYFLVHQPVEAMIPETANLMAKVLHGSLPAGDDSVLSLL